MNTDKFTATQEPKKKKSGKKTVRIILIVVVGLAILVFGGAFLVNAAYNSYLIGDMDIYTFTLSDGGELTKDDAAAIQTILDARAFARYGPGGYGAPKVSVKGGQLQITVRPNDMNAKQAALFMLSGKVSIVAEGGVLAEADSVLSAEYKTGDSLDSNLWVTLSDNGYSTVISRLEADPYTALDMVIDGRTLEYPFCSGDYILQNADGSAIPTASTSMQFADALILAAVINNPMDYVLTPVGSSESAPQPSAESALDVPSPTFSVDPDAYLAMPEPQAGELLYTGTAEFENCDGVTVSFILSADGSEIHDLSVTVANLTVTTVSGSTQTTHSVGASTSKLTNPVTVENGAVDAFLGDGCQMTLTGLGGDEATGQLTYSYTFSGTPDETVSLGDSDLTVTVSKRG